jgi:hypothetical protein
MLHRELLLLRMLLLLRHLPHAQRPWSVLLLFLMLHRLRFVQLPQLLWLTRRRWNAQRPSHGLRLLRHTSQLSLMLLLRLRPMLHLHLGLRLHHVRLLSLMRRPSRKSPKRNNANSKFL